MAATSAASRLTEAHRVAQLRLGAGTVQQMLTVWPLLDPADIEGSIEAWLRIVEPLIQAQRSKSATLAGNYLTAFRTLELGPGAFVPTIVDVADAAALRTSMMVTGPIRIRALLGAGVKIEKAAQTANMAAARSAMRHTMNGGRDTIVATVENDQKALGFARAASGKACHFCAMLAGRGPVFKTHDAALHRGDGHRYHDGCSCTVEPAYHRDAEWPDGSRHYQDLWRQSTHGLSGQDAVNAFRQSLNA